MSPVRNPFDSSDDESGSPVKSSSKAAINPFDDDSNFQPRAAVSKPQKTSHRGASKAPNPFDDEEDGGGSFQSSLNSQSRTTQHKSFLDEEDYGGFSNSPPKTAQKKEPGRSHFKARFSASGDAAVRTAQKIKDAGSTQGSKIVDGSVAQMSKVKEHTSSAFKSGNTQANPRKSGNTQRDGLDDGMRNELFGGASAARPSRVRYDDSQFQKQDLEYKSMEELEGYALQKSEETTSTVQNCLRVAEEMKADATTTLLTLHEQGEQIRKIHESTLDIDQSLTRGEKLLGSLGGMFSKTWKPKKTRPISGPAFRKNDSFKRRGYHLEQRVALGLTRNNSKGRGNRVTPSSTNRQETVQDKLEFEKEKQDDALSALSDVLGELKIMSQDMGYEIQSQNVAVDDLDKDVDTLQERIKGANYRATRLLGR
ncbi:hypothetical protein KP509_02G027300 [Ceratopteris richardii]|uniref:t-SNARE coiled-coil homology domain-containing protein n=1 Tax=Ceratopteris richardii TaxID=49495 RepID=A0A8T2VBA7_CERRI|nr:hypothetical protein KP509_02G027300 [Ceratopteris richardii]